MVLMRQQGAVQPSQFGQHRSQIQREHDRMHCVMNDLRRRAASSLNESVGRNIPDDLPGRGDM